MPPLSPSKAPGSAWPLPPIPTWSARCSFAGGDIGKLAVHGTVNDLAVSGATPLYLSVGFILEEGFSLSDLRRIVNSMAEAARDAGVSIVTGDTKVVQRGKADGIFINTAGVGPDARHLAHGRAAG